MIAYIVLQNSERLHKIYFYFLHMQTLYLDITNNEGILNK